MGNFHSPLGNFESYEDLWHQDVEKIKRLLASGKGSTIGESSATTPLIIHCVRSGDEKNDETDARKCEILKVLIEHRIDVNACTPSEGPPCWRGKTAAMVAAERGLVNCLRCLVDSGADLSVSSELGETAIMSAATSGQVSCVKYLSEILSVSELNRKNCSGQTALMLAVCNSQGKGSRCLQLLIAAGADLDAQDKDGDTALILAVKNKQVDCLIHLVEYMSASKLNLRNNEGKTALMLAASKQGESNSRCLKLLISSGSAMDLQDEDGNTALMLAIRNKKLDAVSSLINAGAELDVEDKDSYIALMHALKTWSSESVNLLLDNEASVNQVAKSGDTPLSVALRGDSDYKIIDNLLRRGLDPTKSRQDRHCVHDAVVYGPDAVLRALVMNGFPPLDLECQSLVDRYNSIPRHPWSRPVVRPSSTPMSPLAVALRFGRPEVARYLIANRFFTRYDVERLCWAPETSQWLQHTSKVLGQTQYLQAWRNGDGSNASCPRYPRLRQCSEILDFLSARPLSLRDLTLIAISSVLSQHLIYDSRGAPRDEHYNWVCVPTFRERVQSLELPAALKRELLHQTPSSSICCCSWRDIPQDDGRTNFSTCHCNDSVGANTL